MLRLAFDGEEAPCRDPPSTSSRRARSPLSRPLRPSFRPDGDEPLTVMCAVLDAGHGLSKLVATGVDGEDGRIVSVDGYAPRLFADVERRLREKAVDRSGSFARP